MRSWGVLFIVALLLVSPVHAQSQPLSDDRSGDVSSSIGAPAPSNMAEIDLLSLSTLETPRDMVFIIEVADLEAEAAPEMRASAFEIEFQHNGAWFQVYVGRNNVAGTSPFFGTISQVDTSSGRLNFLASLEPDVDFDEETLTITVARDLLRDGSGATPFPGRALDDFVVTSYGNRLFRGDINIGGTVIGDGHYSDRLPDDGTAGPVPILLGVQQSGDARLRSDEPFRASNGEATTYVFQVRALNTGLETQNFRFNTTSVPQNWDISFPAGDVEIGANRAITVPIIVGTAFAHNHGSTESFILEMTATQDPDSVGRVEMGVHYPKIPQPAGHHDTVWIHSNAPTGDPFELIFGDVLGIANSGADGYFNAIEDDERADDVPIPGQRCGLGVSGSNDPTPRQRYCWFLPLDPGLQLGLDFDLSRTGLADLTFGSDLPASAGIVSAELIYIPPRGNDDFNPGNSGAQFGDDSFVLARANATEVGDVGTSKNVELQLIPTPESDFIEYAPNAALRLDIRLEALRADNPLFGPRPPAPTLAAGGFLKLPLNEYADPVVDIIDIGELGLSFEAITEQERLVNPGETVLFKALLKNTGNATDVDVDIIGTGRDWARLLTEPYLNVDGSAEIILAVTAPEDAADGETADLILEAANVNDIEDQTLIRFVATVDSTEDLLDESEAAEALMGTSEKKSPGLPLLLLLGAILLARRR